MGTLILPRKPEPEWTVIVTGEIKDEHKVRACLITLGHPPIISPENLADIRLREKERERGLLALSGKGEPK
ncbi:MAG: hypothetical protein WCD76_12355 [Pyrinomonadaceae bacterium]